MITEWANVALLAGLTSSVLAATAALLTYLRSKRREDRLLHEKGITRAALQNEIARSVAREDSTTVRLTMPDGALYEVTFPADSDYGRIRLILDRLVDTSKAGGKSADPSQSEIPIDPPPQDTA
jgi:hypothetical protein